MKKTILALVSLPLWFACASGPTPGGSFTWHMPSVGVVPHRPGFTYVKLNVVGVAEMKTVQKRMFKRKEIGLVNAALQEIYAQIPTDGNAYALVNVIVDSTTTRYYQVVTQRNGTYQETFLREEPKTLIVRADIIQFTQVNLENMPGRAFRMDDEGRNALQAFVTQHLQHAGNTDG